MINLSLSAKPYTENNRLVNISEGVHSLTVPPHLCDGQLGKIT